MPNSPAAASPRLKERDRIIVALDVETASDGRAIIRELRGEKIDIIEWSDEPSVFAANSLSPAKVNQVRITDIDRRQMEVIVNEDQLSLAIGKRGQNVRLATKLVGWNIDIRSEDEIKREVSAQMGALIASGGAVPLSALEGVTAVTTTALAEHGIEDIDTLAATSVDDLTEHLDISLDAAQEILASAQRVVAARDASKVAENDGANADDAADGIAEETRDITEQHAASVELDETTDPGEVEPSDAMTNEGYDEAVRGGTPFQAEPEIMAAASADPVAASEVEPMSDDELAMQGAGRDLRPDTITPSPDMTSTEAAMVADETAAADEDAPAEAEESAPEHRIETNDKREAAAREKQDDASDSPE